VPKDKFPICNLVLYTFKQIVGRCNGNKLLFNAWPEIEHMDL